VFKRVAIYIFGLFVLAFGTNFSINSDLGVTPVSAVPFISSLILDIDAGVLFTAMFVIFVALQILLLRAEFKWINLTQIIFSFIFGYFVDFAALILNGFVFPTYFGQLFTNFIGIVLVSLGIVLYMKARLVSLPPEGFVEALAVKIPQLPFYRAKIAKDSALVIIAVVLSLVFLGGVVGVREGTLLAALLIGWLIPVIEKILRHMQNIAFRRFL